MVRDLGSDRERPLHSSQVQQKPAELGINCQTSVRAVFKQVRTRRRTRICRHPRPAQRHTEQSQKVLQTHTAKPNLRRALAVRAQDPKSVERGFC